MAVMQYKFCIFFSEFVLYLNLFFWCYTVRYILNLSFMTSLFRTVMENFSLTCTQAMKLSVYHGYVKIKVKLLVCKLLFMTVSWILMFCFATQIYKFCTIMKNTICKSLWYVISIELFDCRPLLTVLRTV